MIDIRLTRRVLSAALSVGLAGGAFAVIVAPNTASAAPIVISTDTAQAVPIGTGSLTVTFNCEAVATGVALVSTTGVGCYIQGKTYGDIHGAPSVWAPGEASATTATYSGLAVQGYRLCIGAGYILLDGTTAAWATYRCDENPL